LFGVYELAVALCSQVLNVVDQEWIGRFVVGEKDDLCSSSR